jgi:hypothetical protein
MVFQLILSVFLLGTRYVSYTRSETALIEKILSSPAEMDRHSALEMRHLAMTADKHIAFDEPPEGALFGQREPSFIFIPSGANVLPPSSLDSSSGSESSSSDESLRYVLPPSEPANRPHRRQRPQAAKRAVNAEEVYWPSDPLHLTQRDRRRGAKSPT